MRRWSTSKLNFSIQCPSYFLLFLSFFFLGSACAQKLRNSTTFLCEKNQRGMNFDLDIKPPTYRNKEKQQERERERERERVRVRVRVWLFASFENVRKWAVSEHGSDCHGCCYCSYREDGSSNNNTRATRTSTTEDPSSSALLVAHTNSSKLFCVYVHMCEFVFFFGSNFWQFYNTLSSDRRLWRFFNCDRYSLPILILLYFFSLFSRRCGIFHVTESISPNWREIRVFIQKKSLHFSYFAKLARN